MARRSAAPILLAAAALLLGGAAPPGTVRYRMRPAIAKDGAPALQIDMRFRGDADGETALDLPGEWAGSSELWRHVTELAIGGAKRVEGTFDRPIVRHRPGALIRVRYKLRSAWAEDPGFDYEKARPLIRPDWFFAHGEGLFAVPEGRFAGPARFRWGKRPKGWRTASDLDHLGGKRTTIANMIDSVVIGGAALRVAERDLSGARLRVATLGEWSFDPEDLAGLVERIVVASDDYWGDKHSPFLVALAPIGTVPSGRSFTGTGRTDAFSIAATSNFDLVTAVRFIGHEYGHSWIPNELGGLPQADEPRDYWFSEGFDDYVATRVLLRSGLWSLADFVADKNETLLRYGTSPARTAGAAEVTARFWTDAAIRQVSYDRGHLLAALFDGRIRAASGGKKGLDEVLRAQRKAATASAEPATALFARMLHDQAGLDAAPEIEAHARDGAAILLPEDLYGDCAVIATERRREFQRGYDSQATRLAGGVITGVDPEGPAFAAGMRDGMRLIRFESGKIGDARVPVTFRVDDGTGEKLITYLPEGKGEFEVQRMILTLLAPEDEARCRIVMAGGK
jgi:predicted metalloprotease with PDZ domain